MTKREKFSPVPTAPRMPDVSPLPRPGSPGPAKQAAEAVPPSGSTAQAPDQVPPTVARAFMRPRHALLILSFVLVVLVPTGVSGWYLWTLAADQYVSKVGFSVRREDNNSAIDLLGGLTSFSGSSSSDTDILYEFIQSQRLVVDIDKALDLRRIWSKPEGDPIFSLDPDASVEDLVSYWNNMVRLSYGAGSGLLEVEVRAFAPEDATKIAETLFDESSEMINQLSAIARADAISYAREELDVAQERLKEARETITRFRNENQIINPESDLQSQAGLLGSLHVQQAEALIEIDMLNDTARAGDPRLEQAERRLAVIEKRIGAERQKLGFQGAEVGDNAFSEIVGEYERLTLDRQFAEKTYVGALAAYDSAQAEARRKTRYLAAYMEPTQAQTAKYPSRPTLLMLVGLFLFLIWSITSLVIYSVKDRR
ncbi:hypothetical protein FIU89_21895 (plasmid) [Roseovarius sp. THAF27]|uniref:capsule biosynthesis protein n=1 Tax=unclassified Roseovarius TaxID=2614913 RepID=UPI0012A9D4DE|nr:MULTISPECIES: capsule biosynthesis protein [unclassified Roseovarius]QFT83290.1 hypothetical protein FIU89_21895 [Roseovarius sp. THAF27]QFT99948.1 hypothetical protein FIU85_21690 [Roseovarius sp. THAF8]